MKGDALTTTGVLNDAARIVRSVAAPWAGVLAITLVPLRIAEVFFVTRLAILGSGAGDYGRYLSRLALWVALAFVVASWGRLAYVRACSRAAGSLETGWRDVLRVPLAVLLNYLVVALVIQIFGIVVGVTVVGIPVAALLLGLATATAHIEERPGIADPFRVLGRFGNRLGPMIGITFVFTIALAATIVNLGIGASAVVWIASAIPGFDAARWNALLDGRLFDLLVVASALMVLEPYWLAAWVAYVRRAQDRESGDDLAERFRRLTSPSVRRRATDAAMVAVAVVASLGITVSVRAETLSLPGYRATLVAIERDVTAGRVDAAIETARAIRGAAIATPDGTFEADGTLIADIERLHETPRLALGVRHRLATAIDALSTTDSGRAPRADHALLASIADSQKLDAIAKGGSVGRLPAFSESATEQISRWWTTAIDWLAGKLERIVDWIVSLWPRKSGKTVSERLHGVSIPVALTALAVLGLVALLAIHVVRNARGGPPVTVESESIRESIRDADPLSREAVEWERYAAQLAREGRLREAIRAWYHAVLVTLYGAGILHYRKGRTNWEYLAAIPPAIGWRAVFASLTREFDREWYGRMQPTPDSFESFAGDARRILHDVERGERT